MAKKVRATKHEYSNQLFITRCALAIWNKNTPLSFENMSRKLWDKKKFDLDNFIPATVLIEYGKIMAVSMREKEIIRFGYIGLPKLKIATLMKKSELMLSMQISSIQRYGIMNEYINKGNKCNLSIETKDFYVAMRPIDSRTMQLHHNEELWAEIKAEYNVDWKKHDGENPNRPFNVYFAYMLKGIIDQHIKLEKNSQT